MILAQNPRLQLNGNSKWFGLILVLMLALLVACGDGGDENGTDDSDAGNIAPATQMANTVELQVTVGRATAFNIPDRNGVEVFTLVEGDRVESAGRSEPDALGTVFYVVRFGDLSGWVAETQVEVLRGSPEDLLLVPSDAFALNVIEETEQAQQRSGTAVNDGAAAFQVFAQALVDAAPVYASPSLDAEVLQTVDTGAQLEIIASTMPTADGLVFYGIRLQPQGQGWVTNRTFEHVGNLDLRQRVVIEDSILTETPTLEPAAATALALAPTVTPVPPSPTSVASGPTLPPQTDNLPSQTPSITPFVNESAQPDEAGSAAQATTNPIATATPTTSSSPTAAPTATPRSIRPAEPPLLDIALPANWEALHLLVPLESSIFLDTDIVLSLYEGPIDAETTGRIQVLWRFPDLYPVGQESTLWPNAVLYLRNLLYTDCTIGIYTDQRQEYSIGGRPAIGTTFSAINCLNGSPDVAGWFGALEVEGENYVFYMTVEPASQIDTARAVLQSVVRSINFVLLDS